MSFRSYFPSPPGGVTALLLLLFCPSLMFAHGVGESDQAFMEQVTGVQFVPYLYLGAKHMVSGYDHLLFLIGVIFFLYRTREVLLYVTLFSVGHSITLLLGVIGGIHLNPYLIDAIIGLSVVYKALDNLGAFKTWFGIQPNTKAAVLIFGLFHGFGLATKIQDFKLPENGLVPNIIAFNIGVEVGQLIALAFVLIAMGFWRRTDGFRRDAALSNVALMTSGFLLIGYQITAYFTRSA